MAIRAQWTWTSGTSNFWQDSGMASSNYKAWSRSGHENASMYYSPWRSATPPYLSWLLCHATWRILVLPNRYCYAKETTLIGKWIPLLPISLVETLQRKRVAIEVRPDPRSTSYRDSEANNTCSPNPEGRQVVCDVCYRMSTLRKEPGYTERKPSFRWSPVIVVSVRLVLVCSAAVRDS